MHYQTFYLYYRLISSVSLNIKHGLLSPKKKMVRDILLFQRKMCNFGKVIYIYIEL